jgi:hypothetical protein
MGPSLSLALLREKTENRSIREGEIRINDFSFYEEELLDRKSKQILRNDM